MALRKRLDLSVLQPQETIPPAPVELAVENSGDISVERGPLPRFLSPRKSEETNSYYFKPLSLW